ncbi:nucleotide excision repair endonuclease [Rhodohalobacter mucosus]|uniref:GIY-YIG domain-containing protein n=1 Tax=Rhodohalobacter mucosus TaxID=2079485 RepID=A0A316TMB7_9BACT|nr:nucleotide excision repair endonuclease [Rhodohalobacter mucosus]PWN05737.1 hypothetical protein DDZ15_14225 [Rhodohalobacter mucosus]
MDAQTPSFFSAEPLLERRLGRGPFDAVPSVPGVYRFYDRNGNLLYVGKAKNLRTRLFSYKRAKPGQVSRKVSELIGQIRSFVYVETPTEKDALLLENRMIRGERPPYNHANKETETYYFVYLRPDNEGLEFRLAMRIHKETDPKYWHGCYKGHAPVRQALGCLLRLLWMAEYEITDPMHLPVKLNRNLTPMRFALPWNTSASPALTTGLPDLLELWIRGEDDELTDWLAVQIEAGRHLPPFQRLWLEYHLDQITGFYRKKLSRHHTLRNGRNRIAQDELDDLLVKA